MQPDPTIAGTRRFRRVCTIQCVYIQVRFSLFYASLATPGSPPNPFASQCRVYFLSPKGGINAMPSALSRSCPFPNTPAALLALTCCLNNSKTSLPFHLAGTGRYAGRNVPTVCAHSPLAGLTGCVAFSFCSCCVTLPSAPWLDRYGSELWSVPPVAASGDSGCVAQ